MRSIVRASCVVKFIASDRTALLAVGKFVSPRHFSWSPKGAETTRVTFAHVLSNDTHKHIMALPHDIPDSDDHRCQSSRGFVRGVS